MQLPFLHSQQLGIYLLFEKEKRPAHKLDPQDKEIDKPKHLQRAAADFVFNLLSWVRCIPPTPAQGGNKPVQATVLLDGNYYLPETGETIPADMATPSPDDRFHRCAFNPVASDFDPYSIRGSKPKTRCFFAPMHSS